MIANPFAGFWSALAPRERIMIIGGAGIIALTLLILMFSSLLTERSNLKREIAKLEADNEWIITQAELLSRLSNSCQQSQIASVEPLDFLNRQAERNNIRITSRQSQAQNIIVSATATDGNAFLRYSHQILCQGYGISALVIETVEESGYQATIEVNHGS